jgi:methyl-accepting chemotaxis protein
MDGSPECGGRESTDGVNFAPRVAAVAEEAPASGEQVSAATEETTATAHELATATHDLNHTATELGRLVGAEFTLAHD